jgi:hypothetical protein
VADWQRPLCFGLVQTLSSDIGRLHPSAEHGKVEQQNFLPLTSLKQSIRKNNSPRSGGVDRDTRSSPTITRWFAKIGSLRFLAICFNRQAKERLSNSALVLQAPVAIHISL